MPEGRQRMTENEKIWVSVVTIVALTAYAMALFACLTG